MEIAARAVSLPTANGQRGFRAQSRRTFSTAPVAGVSPTEQIVAIAAVIGPSVLQLSGARSAAGLAVHRHGPSVVVRV